MHDAWPGGQAGCALCQAAQQWLAGGPLTPKVLVEALETSITQGVLTPQTARTCEEQVLQRTDATGQWKGAT